MKRLLTTVALLALLVPTLGQAATITLLDGEDLAAAVTAASPGDIIELDNGTYTLTSQLTLTKSVTITGKNMDASLVTIDCSTVGGYGIAPRSSDVTLEYFTMLPPTPNYPIHASGTANPLGLDNLIIQHVIIEGTHQRTGFDVHGYNNVTLSHLTSKDATGGNGISITGCVGVDIDNITTANNVWGSLAIYISGASYLSRGSDDVVIDGTTLSLNEGVLFQQDEGGFFSTNVTVLGYDYLVYNDQFRLGVGLGYPDSEGYTFFEQDLAAATSKALSFAGYEEYSSMQRISDGHWVVNAGMTIQTAIDDAMAGGTVEVLAGTYPENLTMSKSISVLGPNASLSPNTDVRVAEAVLAPAGGSHAIEGLAPNIVVTWAGMTIDMSNGLEDDRFVHMTNQLDTTWVFEHDIFANGPGAINGAWWFTGANGNLGFNLLDNLITDNGVSNGISLWGSGVNNVDIRDNVFEDSQGWALNLNHAQGQIADNIVRDNSLDGPEWYNDQAGFIIAADNNDVTLTGNTFTNMATWAVNIYDNFEGALVGTDNEFVNAQDGGVRIRPGGVVDLSGVEFHNNTFLGNALAIENNQASLLDATCNWYGDISGPAATDPVNAGTGDAIVGEVLYWPWLDGPGGTCDQYGSDVIAANPTGEISACSPCLPVPIELSRTDTSTLLGVSVTFQLSSEIELCGSEVQVATGAGSLFDGYTNTNLQVIDHGGGSYTADVALLGTPCGPTVGGDVFTINVSAAGGITTDTTGTITVTGVTVRDCTNAPLPGVPGPPASVTINNGAPGTVADLSASQVKTGNDSNGTTKIDLTWTDPGDPDLATIEIYRKGFGFYPEYDDGGGVAPTAPATPGAGGWDFVASVPAGAGSYQDEPGDRDFWYYVVFANDGCNDGAVSNRTGGTLNYHLGDVAPPPNGNNLVLTGDIAALGAAYGSVDVPGDLDYDNAVDVGPTTTNFVDGRPETDNQIQFEDLLMFAINYGQVSKRPDGLASAGRSDLQLMVPSLPAAGEIFEVSLVMAGDGTVHGVSTDVTWNDARVEYLGFAPGELMNRQGTYAPVFSPKVGRLDAAVFGTERGILGEGTLATLRFKVRESGDAGFEIASIDARNGDNEDASIGSSVVSGVPGASTTAKVTQLLPNIPNPFNPATEIRFVVGQKGPVSVQIYSLQGRLVRTLVQEPMDAGEASLTWHGRDDSGRTVASGTYVVRIDGADRTHTRNIVLLK